MLRACGGCESLASTDQGPVPAITQKHKAEQHANIDSGFVGSSPETLLQKHWRVRGSNRNRDVNQQRDCRKTGEETGDDAGTKRDLDHSHERRHHGGRWYPDFGESADSQ